MIALLSPAKTLDESPVSGFPSTQTRLQDKSLQLIKKLRRKSIGSIQELMSVSEKLATLNKTRYKTYEEVFTTENAKPAALMFKGDVYTGLEAASFSEQEMSFAQSHLRILSGLYGLLRPLDLIQPYRLEMGSKLQVAKHKNLYSFWGDDITNLINEDLAASQGDTIINLASQEYFHSIKIDKLKGEVINVHFKEDRGGKLKVISFNAKKARGKMAQLFIKEQLTEAEELKTLVADDYVFNSALSTSNDWVFIK